MRARIRPALSLPLALLVAACGGGGGGKDPAAPPGNPPVVQVYFPPADALTDQTTVAVFGTASDPDGVASLTVGGLAAGTSNAFADWKASLPVASGDQLFSVDAVDAKGNASAPAAGPFLLRRTGRLLSQVPSLAYDPNVGRLRAVDAPSKLLVEIDPVAGTLRTFSDVGGGVGAGPSFGTIAGVASEPISGMTYVTCASDRLMRVEPVHGDRTIVSGPGAGAGPALNDGGGIVISPNGATAWVVNRGDSTILAVDLGNGNRTLVSGGGAGNGPAFSNTLRGAALDVVGGRLFVLQVGPAAVYSVELATGNRAVVSDSGTGTGPTLSYPSNAVYDAANARLIVSDATAHRVLAIDVASGNRTELSGASVGTGARLLGPDGLAADFAGGRVFAADGSTPSIVAIDLATGNRSIAHRSSIGTGPALIQMTALAPDYAHGRMLVGRSGVQDLVGVDLHTGDRTTFALTGIAGMNPVDLFVDAAADRAIVIDGSGGGRVLAVDLPTGATTVVSGAGLGSGPLFGTLKKGALDAVHHRVFVADQGVVALLSVDLTNGARAIVSGAGVGVGPAMSAPGSVVLAPDGLHAFVFDFATSTLLRIDLATGDRTVASSANVGTGAPMSSGASACIRADGTRIYAADTGRVIAIDPANGNRTAVTGFGAGKGPTSWSWLYALVIDPSGNVLWYGDGVNSAIFAVDVATGDRVVVSR